MKSETLAALDALIARQVESVSLKAVSNTAVELPARSSKLLPVTTVSTPRGGWDAQTFFVVDADAAGASKPPRHRVHLAYPPKARRVVAEITPQVRRALGTATQVRVMYSDDTELNLLRLLRSCMDEVTRGPLVLDLWTPARVPDVSMVDGLNPEQAQAFAAMTSGGGWLVWGPPGTGKTTVIVKAVADALANGRSVLIASHTHVAVDNVVKDLAETVAEPGHVVRVGDQEKIDPKVAGHDWLMLDKAAAVLTEREERLAEIMERQRANESDPARQRLDSVIDKLDQTDLPLIEKAYHAQEQAARADELYRNLSEIQQEMQRRESEISRLRRDADDEEPASDLLPSLIRGNEQIAEQQRQLAATITSIDATLKTTQAAYDALIQILVEVEQERNTWSGRLPWRRAVLDEQYTATTDALPSVLARVASLEAELANRRDQDRSLAAVRVETNRRITAAERAAQHAEVLRTRAALLEVAQQHDAARKRRAETDAAHARAEADAVDDYEQIIARAEHDGIARLIDEREELNEVVAHLNEKLGDLDREKRRLDDEYKNTKRELLESAPIIGCTLTALTTKPELSNRRFDTVIIDEAASASIPHLIHAGSKADRCLAYVGDFLQNSPITDTDDAKTDRQQQLLAWQRDDISALLGIRDRATAEGHPRCVALRTQFRYPEVIADIVNDFCYDGLLETAWTGTIEGPVVTFIDTSTHLEQGLHRSGTSWVHPLGLRLMDVIYEFRDTTGTIGLVCPYNAHAHRANARSRDNGYDMPCGTSHKFQGRQFDTVIVDLMQDDQPRWVAWADLAGGEREVSAAKLLNVAITRAKSRLFIIGNWNFVRSMQTPGMQAIARLRHRPDFELADAMDVCGERAE
ncbi:AAA domain-containing protein [Nocardia sp. NPDC005366]|uniref:DEAD/DEAH box helicase n=1 Tax=Nocardia sp. NPDC005366 TaxID=3156878 RepID=UPI0033B2BDA0